MRCVAFRIHTLAAATFATVAVAASGTRSAGAVDGPIELGRVRWGRDVDAGFARARQTGQPVLLLFQEIPGCATCVGFGSGPLCNPLLVDAIETEFVPVAVYNNRDGTDAATLKRFGEPAWNNPVVRFFAPDGSELLERRDGIWDTSGLAARMVDALRAAARPVPNYLTVAEQEAAAVQAQRATFAMHCFWQGEAALGALDGVVGTRVGWLDGREVVEVHYLPQRLDYTTLVARAIALDSAQRVFAHTDSQFEAAQKQLGDRVVRSNDVARDADESDRKWHLQRWRLSTLSLTPTQAARVNADLARGDDGMRWLSPRQRKRSEASN